MAGMMVGDAGSSSFSTPRQMSSVLTDQDRKAAALPIEVFGEPLVEHFYAKSFLQKEEGFRDLMNDLKSGDESVKADKKTRAATFLLMRGLKDKMYTVSQQAVEALAYLTGPYASRHKTSKRELSNTMEAALPELIQKLGENATRVQTMAAEGLLQLAETAHGRRMPDVTAALAAPLRGAVHTRVALGRIETVEKIIIKYGVTNDDGPQSTEQLAKFALSALEQPGDQLRAAGSRLLLLVYPEDRQVVRSLLTSGGKNKNSNYRSLLAELDRLDGKRAPVASLRLEAQLQPVREEAEAKQRAGHADSPTPQPRAALQDGGAHCRGRADGHDDDDER
ncbi:uncharacterized protein LOC119105450 [Pollicipes pollicipes]|uniref:uncharacterized protein LOC119105450 n=1 Tax=Pollicipes pollicipes TaxID=41117 RepID=UPI00188542B2|nr:uncharacterized protein LOC119105450 [Pollicipes pollicipes]